MDESELQSPSTSTSGLLAANRESPEPCSSQELHEDMDTSSLDEVILPQSSASVVRNPLAGWTKAEKFELYLGIKHKGSKNVKDIQDKIPTKTTAQIIAAISHYKERAQQTPECATKTMKIKRKKSQKSNIPLASWAKLLTDNLSFEELHTEMASALRLIADFDDIPPAYLTEQIDFRKAYHQIADAMEGKELTNIEYISDMLNSCLFETAIISNSFMPPTTVKNIVNSIDLSEPIPGFPRHTANPEESIMRQLVSQKNYNPLGISHALITPPDTRADDALKKKKKNLASLKNNVML